MLCGRMTSLMAVLMLLAATTVAEAPAGISSAAPPKPDPAIAAALREVSPAQIEKTIVKLVSFGNRSTLSVTQPAASGHGIAAARDWIKSEFERYSKDCGNCLEVGTDTFTQPASDRVSQPTEISNVYAILRGANPAAASRMVLVSGHYDSRNSDNANTTDAAPGANDDGSGTAVSLECARVLSRRRFPATIIFLAVAGEEQGLYGSAHFAKMAREKRWNIEAFLNNDIVGGNHSPPSPKEPGTRNPKTVRVFSEGVPTAATDSELRLLRALGGENDSPSRLLARYIAEVDREYLDGFQPTLIYRRDRYLRGGDHISFNQEGFAAVRFTEWLEDFHHQHQNVRSENGIEYGDLPKFVDYNYIANVARLNAATLASLAAAPGPPMNVKLETRELENSSRLSWEPAADGLASAYQVLWRATDASRWEHVENVGKVTRVSLPVSKDNVIFAVQAMDSAGHASLPVVPAPER
jgi:Peptidase family M28